LQHVTEPATTATVPGPIVVLGSRVRVRDMEGEHEYPMVIRVMAGAPPECVSTASPVGRALLGRWLGDQVQVQTPGGVRLLTVVDVAATAPSSAAGSARRCEP
jgi:transcription elongation GreA/GreB family factor